jgi:hypothetical protein
MLDLYLAGHSQKQAAKRQDNIAPAFGVIYRHRRPPPSWWRLIVTSLYKSRYSLSEWTCPANPGSSVAAEKPSLTRPSTHLPRVRNQG